MYQSDVEGAKALVQKYEQLKNEISKVIIGQNEIVHNTILSVFCQGHVLLVGVPGLAKTLLVSTIGRALGLSFNRIQFTPDLMPSDILGTEIIDDTRQFKFVKGPVFSNIILADEINRTPPKTQAALLEAMQEKHVTVSGKTYKLQEPFFVLATQNPIEQEGTYPLPEAQVDRFLLKVVIGYPTRNEEKTIIRQNINPEQKTVRPLLRPEHVIEAQKVVEQIYLDEKIERYIVDIVFATRFPAEYGLNDLQSIISFGASPRASIGLARAARAYAFICGRGFVIPEDVRAVCHDVLRHRIGLSYEAEANNITADAIISEILNKVEVP